MYVPANLCSGRLYEILIVTIKFLLVFNGVPSSCFPSSTGLGSTFDVDLALKIGKALGDESRAKGNISLSYISYICPLLICPLFRLSHFACAYCKHSALAVRRSRIRVIFGRSSSERNDRGGLYQRGAVERGRSYNQTLCSKRSRIPQVVWASQTLNID